MHVIFMKGIPNLNGLIWDAFCFSLVAVHRRIKALENGIEFAALRRES